MKRIRRVFISYLRLFSALFVLIVLLSCCRGPGDQRISGVERFELIAEIARDRESPFFIDFPNYPKRRNDLPIGVFDSGTGGLTVLDAILKMDAFNNQNYQPGGDGIPDFTGESFIYLGDNANMPYGRYDVEGKADFLRELVLKNVQFLLGRKYYLRPEDTIPQEDKLPVKAIVIACNTATAFGLELINRAFQSWGLDLKVIGIIEAGARTVRNGSNEADGRGVIAVFATEGACASQGYPRAIQSAFAGGQAGSPPVVQQAGFGLAGAIDGDSSYIDPGTSEIRSEKKYQGPSLNHPRYPIRLELWEEYGFESGPGLLTKSDESGGLIEVQLNSVTNYIRFYVTELVRKVWTDYPGKPLTAVILGCTHYPFFEERIREHFEYLRNRNDKLRRIIPAALSLIDPALSEARELYFYLREKNLFSGGKLPACRFFISHPNPDLDVIEFDPQKNFTVSYKYGRDINQSLLYVKRIPLSEQWVPSEVWDMIKSKMPQIFRLIGEAAPDPGSDSYKH